MPEARLRVAVLGTGGIAQHHLAVLEALLDVEIAALASRRPEPRAAVAARFGSPPTYGGVDELLANERPDAVVVAVSVLSTVEVAAACLRQGVPALIEKPPGLTVAETSSLAAEADASGTLAMIALNRRFYSVIRRAHEAVTGAGPLVGLAVEAPESLDEVRALGLHPARVLEHWLAANGIHAVDLLRFLGGEVKEVAVARRAWREPSGDSFAALVQFEGGAVGQYMSHWTTPGRWRIDLYGLDVRATLQPWEQGQIQRRDAEPEPIPSDPVDQRFKPGFYGQMRYFLDCVCAGWPIERPGANLHDALQTMRLIERLARGASYA